MRALLRRGSMLSAAPVLLPRNTLCVSLLQGRALESVVFLELLTSNEETVW